MYKKLRSVIDDIKIIDNHGHPGFAKYFENVPKDKRISFAVDIYKDPEEVSYGFPYLKELHYEAYNKLYNFSRKDIDNEAKRDELNNKYQKKREDLDDFIDVVMKEAGVETLIGNYVLPESLKSKENIEFIPVIDPVILPFDNTYLKQSLLSESFVKTAEYLLDELMDKYDFNKIFANQGLDGYLKFIDKVINEYVKEGIVGFKLALTYYRTSYFEKIDKEQADVLYREAKNGNINSYKKLQDFLVWYLMEKSIEYDLPIQIHFAVTDTPVENFDPMNLSNVLNDQKLKDVKIVILHAGYPRYERARLMALGGLSPNNVYIDISGRVMFGNHPKIIAKMLRGFLEFPALWDKILYGSDVLWGDRYIYTAAKTGRDAVYYALEGMLDEEIIDEDKAIMIAKKIFRDNSLDLYNLDR
ncbi:amidohydrolase family protein [Natroniella sp. ANB-PHB2]|uniref:amidohydrolase family protein n=1 Tax=Natroniella sp. ANB-PHB2 TaxID=3384444 RepID=UPI0038D413B2